MDTPFRSNIHLHQPSRVDYALDRTAAEYQLHTLNLPPSPPSLGMHEPGYQAQSLQLSHPSDLTPLHSSFGSRSPSPSTWQLCPHTPVQQPSSPTSLDGLDSTTCDYQRPTDYQRYPSPLLSDGFSASEGQPYPALMASSGFGTPPGSTDGRSTDLDRHPHLYLQNSTPMPDDYLSPAAHSHPYGEPPYGRDAPMEISHSRSDLCPSPPYVYSSYGVDQRSPQPYQPNDLPSLPWPATLPRNLTPPPPMVGPYGQSTWGERSPVSYHGDLQESSYRCASARCRFTATSPEQLTKHQQKHLKIHHCRFSSCSRTEGFATPNDRERHEKSIHKIPGCYWKCLDSHCSSYGKEFSRRDNLKDHLRRMHPVPEGMGENEASALRSRMADMWRFDKGSNAQAKAGERHNGSSP